MRWLRALTARLRGLARRSEAESRMDEEFRFHLEMEIEKLVASGVSAEEARRRATLSFGGVEKHREEMRDGRRLPLVEEPFRDVGYAARSLRRNPGFAAAVILTLGLAIGGTTATFGVVDALFLRAPTGVERPDEVVRLYLIRDDGSIRTAPTGGAGSFVDFTSIRDGTRAFSALAAFQPASMIDLGRGPSARQVIGQPVTASYFSALGVEAAIGRLFAPEEDGVAGAHPVAVVSHGFWARELGSDRRAIGRTLTLNGQRVEIIGVAAEGFIGLEIAPVEVWVPTALATALGLAGNEEWREYPYMVGTGYVGRLAPGVSPERAALEAAAALPRGTSDDMRLDPTPGVLATSLIPARGPNPPRAARLALWLALVSAMVLVIACANVANLLLARGLARSRELAIRSSLGAGRPRLARQLLTESLVLGMLGGMLGVLVALLSSGLVRLIPLPPAAGVIDGRLLGFTLLVSLASVLLFGIAPAIWCTRLQPSDTLKGVRSTEANRGGMRRGLVALQVSLSLVLLVGAGLFVRSLREVYAIDPGLDTDRLLTVSVDLAKAGYADADREAFYQAARERLETMPGVERTAITHFSPIGGPSMSMAFDKLDGDTLTIDDGPYVHWVGSGYFETAGTRLLRGRGFGPSDRPASEPVAVVNERMARLLAGDGEVLGECLRGPDDCARIVGVVENTRQRYLEDLAVPKVYFAAERNPDAPEWSPPVLLVRTSADAPAALADVRAAVQAMRPDLPYVTVQPLEEMFRADTLPFRLGAILFSVFGTLALALASVGAYGVLSYFVAERTREIGIRRSLGAPARAVVGLMVRQGMAPVGLGIVLGLALAFAGTRFVESQLFSVSSRDPLTFLFVPAVLLFVSLLATLVPARRAARVDPMVALRAD